MKKKLICTTAIMAAALLAGCNGNETAATESDVYMSQFGEYENGEKQSNGWGSENVNGAGNLSMTNNGEMIFEGTLSDGTPVAAEDAAEAENNMADAGNNKNTANNGKSSSNSTKGAAAEENNTVVSDPLVQTADNSVANAGDNTTDGQAIANPTENTSSDDRGSSDFGSGVSQTAGDASNASNGKTDNKATAGME